MMYCPRIFSLLSFQEFPDVSCTTPTYLQSKKMGSILKGENLRYSVNEKTLGEFFFNNGEKFGPQICQIDATIDKSETFASVKLRSTRIAIQLQKRGITSNDVITFCASNTLDTVIPILATFYLGAKVANLEPSLSVRHTKHLLELVTPKIVFVEESAVELIEDSLKDTNLQIEIIIFGQSSKYDTFSDLVKPQKTEESFRPVDVNPDNIIIMFFSSGTTGLPKAICHTHSSFLCVLNRNIQLGMCNAMLHFTSFYWITAMYLLTSSFKTGSYRIFCRNPSAEDIFKIIEKFRVEIILTAPILTYSLTKYNNAGNYDISSLKALMVGGTTIAPIQFKKLTSLFKSATVSNVYAMSEVGVISSFDSPFDKKFVENKSISSGKPMPGISLKIVDTMGKILGPNQKGEICISTPSMMSGYYKMDSSQVFDGENFLKTGDIGYYAEDGSVFVVGRVKEMFKYKSWHIIPSFIEAVLHEHPAVKEAAVFGIPHDEDGEIPAACIVLKEDEKITKEEIDIFVAERVADRERLRGGITFIEALPKTPTGKVVKAEVRDFVLGSQF